MEEELITKETALLAKAKGFNHFYGKSLTEPRLLCSQSLLQRWLREKHNLDVIPSASDLFKQDVEAGRTRTYYYFIHEIGNRICSIPVKFSTYELALEQGLLECLKLLKDEK